MAKRKPKKSKLPIYVIYFVILALLLASLMVLTGMQLRIGGNETGNRTNSSDLFGLFNGSEPYIETTIAHQTTSTLTTIASTTTTSILDPNGDEDGDGFSNGQEIEAGTDPFDPYDKPVCESTSTTSTTTVVTTTIPTTTIPTTTTISVGQNACCERTKTRQRICYSGISCPVLYTKIAQYETGRECSEKCLTASTTTTTIASTTSVTTTSTTTIALCTDQDSDKGGLSAQSFVPEWCWDHIIGYQNDRCTDNSHVVEWTCSNGVCVENAVECSYGCKTSCGVGYCSATSTTTSSTSTTSTSSTSSTTSTTTTSIMTCEGLRQQEGYPYVTNDAGGNSGTCLPKATAGCYNIGRGLWYYRWLDGCCLYGCTDTTITTTTASTTTTSISDCNAYAVQMGEYHGAFYPVGTNCYEPANNYCLTHGYLYSRQYREPCCIWTCQDDPCTDEAAGQGYPHGSEASGVHNSADCISYAQGRCNPNSLSASTYYSYCCLWRCSGE